MSRKLTVLPINTNLDASIIDHVINSIMNVFTTKDDLKKRLYVNISVEKPTTLKSHISIMEEGNAFRATNFLGLKYSIFGYLVSKYGEEDLLAITDYSLMVIDRRTVHGKAYSEKNIRKAMISADVLNAKAMYLAKGILTVLALHELGEINGLEHHSADKENFKLENKKFCPMTPIDQINDPSLQSSDLRLFKNYGEQFCPNCTHFLTGENL